MNSFNHYAYGAVGDWMYRVMAGLEVDPAMPGYKHIRIQPQPGGRFTSASASHQTMYGPVSSAWTLKEGAFELTIEVPPNTRATVRLPKAQLGNVTDSGLHDDCLAAAGRTAPGHVSRIARVTPGRTRRKRYESRRSAPRPLRANRSTSPCTDTCRPVAAPRAASSREPLSC